jgi:hypothetical protein
LKLNFKDDAAPNLAPAEVVAAAAAVPVLAELLATAGVMVLPKVVVLPPVMLWNASCVELDERRMMGGGR